MKLPFFTILASVLFTGLSVAQSDLASYHSTLTTDCKSIRGHAGRIVAEAMHTPLNRDVAAAHLEQVAKFHDEMESQLAASKKLLTAAQLKLVATEYQTLEKKCSTIGTLVSQLRKEFAKGDPDASVLRDQASKMRSEMADGNTVHESLKKKLGIK